MDQKQLARILQVVMDEEPEALPEHLKLFVQKHLPPTRSNSTEYQATQIDAPKGATFIRATDAQGRVSEERRLRARQQGSRVHAAARLCKKDRGRQKLYQPRKRPSEDA